ncbi:WSC-domain-containing protein [Coniochaeta ligniaria NRRL 30616]|uniref:WSC-domain-containing protein n=1 Tax=Coniochaeta ligniaria NRRL 30616 TaxID=1408157 RepID=A0A1J7ISC8_9PEZI|nr:WSC-domain-containing protein [Coniochaeta ligniaria NRRL 30616]
MASTRSALRFASLLCLVAVTAAFPSSSHSSASPAQRRDPSFSRQGCFVNKANSQRIHNTATVASNCMTVEGCAAHCSPYKYFGLEYGRECYCGDVEPTQLVADTGCSFPCSGNAAERCGADTRENAAYFGCFV